MDTLPRCRARERKAERSKVMLLRCVAATEATQAQVLAQKKMIFLLLFVLYVESSSATQVYTHDVLFYYVYVYLQKYVYKYI